MSGFAKREAKTLALVFIHIYLKVYNDYYRQEMYSKY